MKLGIFKLNIVGYKFNKLIVLEKVGVNKSRNILWKCLCDCGNTVIVASNHLKNGHTKSCGCIRKIDLKNKKFGRLKVVKDSGRKSKVGNIIWKCECVCGAVVFVESRNLIRGDTKSCGCYAKHQRFIKNKSNLIGMRFGRLIVNKELPSVGGKGIMWECLCDCGSVIKVFSNSLICGNTKSCGCLQRDTVSKLSSLRCGELSPAWKGGLSFEPYCQIWKDREYKESIKERDGYKCLNPYCDSKNPNDLVVHHVDYDKKNCTPQNLITVCRSCNVFANTERKWHEEWYKLILSKRYGYKYV